MTALRVTWVQPEDLLPHELRQAAQDGRDASGIARRWEAAGGSAAPVHGGASPAPAPPPLRALALRLLDELALLPSPLARAEPTDLAAITRVCGGAVPPLARQAQPPPGGPGATSALHAAWLGRAVGCLLGKPVEKLPLAGIRALARATGNWPLHTWFT
ncbi:ADP-ribosylglycohydrolase family protein, partial [Streptomyces sp. YS-3]